MIKKAAFMHFIQNGMRKEKTRKLMLMSTLTKIDIMIWYQCLEIILFCIISIILIMVIKGRKGI